MKNADTPSYMYDYDTKIGTATEPYREDSPDSIAMSALPTKAQILAFLYAHFDEREQIDEYFDKFNALPQLPLGRELAHLHGYPVYLNDEKYEEARNTYEAYSQLNKEVEKHHKKFPFPIDDPN